MSEIQVGWVLLKPLGGGYDPLVMDVKQDTSQFLPGQVFKRDKYYNITDERIEEHIILPVFVRYSGGTP